MVLLTIILLVILLINLFLMYKSSTAKETKLEDVRLRETSTIKKSTFAIMIEQSDGIYFASDSNVWPTNMAYNSDKSGCIDENGNKIENALSYDSITNLATVSTTGTTYCYLYFDLDKTGPIITNVVDAGYGKITFTVYDELNEISKYCVNSSATDTSDCTWYDAIEGTQTTSSIVTDSGDYYVHVTDSLGNIGHSSVVTMKISQPAGEYIKSAKPSGLNTTLEGGLYRFQGTSVNNYICFGTSIKTTCTGNTDQYMYRIIGINSLGQLKLIKNEALNSVETWSGINGSTWINSNVYSGLNGGLFYTNTTYVPTSWKSKISKTTWKYGDITTYSTTAATIYSTENRWSSTVSNYVGLMYMHDYYYAYQSGGLNCSTEYSTCKKAWLHLRNCDSGSPSASEWSMSRYDSTVAWIVTSDGIASRSDMTNSFSVRPVFYLTSDVQYVSGTGISSDPFIIQ